MAFINFRKASNDTQKGNLTCSREKHIHDWYINTIKNMYESGSQCEAIGGGTNTFQITIDLNQGFTLSSHLFALFIDYLTGHFQNEIPWCMLFANSTILIVYTRAGMNFELRVE